MQGFGKPPHVKKLTLPDLAKRLNEDTELKKKLVANLAPLLPDADAERRVAEAINKTLEELSQPLKRDAVTYQLTCKSCELNHMIEAKDWQNSGIALTCCLCGTNGSFRFPEAEMLITCAVCGVETWLRRVDVPA